MPNAAHYAATRAYVQSLAEALHVELAPLGVDVLGRRPTALPGLLSRALRSAVAPLPRRVRVMGSVMAGMTSHQDPKRPRQA